MRLLLLRADIDTNTRTSNGNTPLLQAANNGHGGVVQLLSAYTVTMG